MVILQLYICVKTHTARNIKGNNPLNANHSYFRIETKQIAQCVSRRHSFTFNSKYSTQSSNCWTNACSICVPHGHWFEFWLLCFPPSNVLTAWQITSKWLKSLGPPSMWETKRKFLATGSWLRFSSDLDFARAVDGRSFCLSFSLCNSAFQIQIKQIFKTIY